MSKIPPPLEYHRPEPPKRSALGGASIIFAILVVPFWFALFVGSNSYQLDPAAARKILPIITFLAFASAISGIITGILGLRKQNENRTMPIIGLSLSLMGFIWMLLIVTDN